VHPESEHPADAVPDANCDLTLATGGQPMVRAAYSSGRPAYGVGAGNSTMVIDETADIDIAARNTRHVEDVRLRFRLLADGNLLIDAQHLRRAGRSARQGRRLSRKQGASRCDRESHVGRHGHRLPQTVACPPQAIAKAAGFEIPADRKFIIVENDKIGPQHNYSREKLTTLLAVYRYHGFDQALELVRRVYDVGGKGHSCGIYLARRRAHRPAGARRTVSRIMVRQPQSKANAARSPTACR
jgi:sulfoacetaldehyde dehydrogenase